MLTFIKDRRGQSVVTYVLVLPVLILFIFGAFALWQVISVKMSLHLGTLQAVDVLSREGARHLDKSLPADVARERWRVQVHPIAVAAITKELKNATMPTTVDSVTVIPPNNIDVPCNSEPPPETMQDVVFTVKAQLSLSPIVIPYIGSVPIVLSESGTGVVECPHYCPPPRPNCLPTEDHSY
jgi:Flp pilus assembly protein TadG